MRLEVYMVVPRVGEVAIVKRRNRLSMIASFPSLGWASSMWNFVEDSVSAGEWLNYLPVLKAWFPPGRA